MKGKVKRKNGGKVEFIFKFFSHLPIKTKKREGEYLLKFSLPYYFFLQIPN